MLTPHERSNLLLHSSSVGIFRSTNDAFELLQKMKYLFLKLNRWDMKLFSRKRRKTWLAQNSNMEWNVAMHVQHNFLGLS